MFNQIKEHPSAQMKNLHKAVTEWIVIDSLPFNTLYRKGFQKFIKHIDPRFRSPSNKAIKNLIADAYMEQKQKVKDLIKESCATGTITTDLWTARSKVGYIGITCHWLTQDFEPIDILLAIEQMPYPHTGEIISDYIKEKITEFDLEDKILFSVTDNGSNMRKAFELLENIERLPCTAHTIQLTVNQALNTIKPFVYRFNKLVKFFTSSPKQTERLDGAQIEYAAREQCRLNKNELVRLNSEENIEYNFECNNDDNEENNEMDNEENNENLEEDLNKNIKILRNIADIKTRWNSSYISWKRLLDLRPAIEWLSNTLPLERSNDSKKDGKLLKQYILKDYEWDLLKKIIEILEPFEKTTRFFSGAKYPTLSLMYPTIQKLKIQYACEPILSSNDCEDEDNLELNLG